MAGTMFIVKADNRACSTYYKINPPFADMSGEHLYGLSARILGAQAHFGLYPLILPMETDLSLSGLAFNRFTVVNCDNIATKDGFACYNFTNGEFPGFAEKSVNVKNRARGCRGSSKTVTL